MLDLTTAKHLADRVSYKPSWSFMSLETWDGNLDFWVSYVAQNSNSENAPDYSGKTRNTLRFAIDLSEVKTELDLYGAILDCIRKCEDHETTEFFKVGPDYDAIFHPHEKRGQLNWKRTGHPEPVTI